MVLNVRDTECMTLKQEAIWNKLAIALLLYRQAITQNRNINLINRLSVRIGRLVYIIEHPRVD